MEQPFHFFLAGAEPWNTITNLWITIIIFHFDLGLVALDLSLFSIVTHPFFGASPH